MDAKNLIPMSRIHERTSRKRRAVWLLVCGTYAGIVFAGTAGARVVMHADRGDTDRRVSDLNQQVDLVDARITRLRAMLADAGRELRRARLVGRHPDWSVLLVLLAGHTGDGLMLEEIDLEPQEDGVGYRVRLGGLAVSQAEVSRFVLALEGSGLFASIRLEGTRRQPVGESEAVGFDLSASIMPTGGVGGRR